MTKWQGLSQWQHDKPEAIHHLAEPSLRDPRFLRVEAIHSPTSRAVFAKPTLGAGRSNPSPARLWFASSLTLLAMTEWQERGSRNDGLTGVLAKTARLWALENDDTI